MARMPDRPCVLNACCPSRDVLSRVGDKWAALIIRCLAKRKRRYNELQRDVDGISQKMLTQTLRGLEEDGLIDRKVYPVIPPMVEYSLTPLGKTLVEPLGAVCEWAEKYLPKIEAHRRERQRMAGSKVKD
jgi:DNA-binding HxlR family transcriptional regulator